MKNFKEYIIKTEPFVPELVSGMLWTLDIAGITEEESFLRVFAVEENKINIGQIEVALTQLKSQNVIVNYSIDENTFEDRNWNEEWEKTIRVIEVSDKIVIKPSFRDYEEKPGQLILTIDPKMSFGTGEHQTTKLMLLMIEKYIKTGVSVLDVGTGTGVLAIAAVKLGAKDAIAVDNDEWCYDNGIENCEQNSVTGKVEIKLGEIKDIVKKDFDLIVANINKPILLEIAQEIRSHINQQGTLILSGLLITDQEEIIRKYTSVGFKPIDRMQMDEWLSLVFCVN
ncbi:MAG: 50S ribosomal protein L11 methyltransferase [Bacillota bacterium]